MVIFDDYEFVKLLIKGDIPKNCEYRNNVLRSCAKLIDRGDYKFSELLNVINEHTKFDIDDDLLAEYVTAQKDYPPIKPHIMVFTEGEVKAIHSLRKKSDQKLYLAMIFAFKYFGTHRLRLAMREFKRMAGLSLSHYSIHDMQLGNGIVIRREKKFTKSLITDYSTNKPYTYYYPRFASGKDMFTFIYEGDCYMLPSAPWESNLSELWSKYKEAADKIYGKR